MTTDFSKFRIGIGRPLIAAIASLILCSCGPTDTTRELPPLGAQIDATSVSGISSGAYMAGQFEMAHAKIVVGAAIIAGGPYGCSQSIFAEALPTPGTEFLNLSKAINGCMLNNLALWGVADPNTLADKARTRADRGEIDPIQDVLGDRVYLFTGTQDRTVVPAIVKSAAEFYSALGLPKDNIKLIETVPAGHAFVTPDKGGACDRSQSPYVVDCDYDQAEALLTHIYGKLEAPSTSAQGSWVEFDQRPFTQDLSPDGMADSGVIYIPEACKSQTGCRIHVAYHGCAQNREMVGDTFIKETGFARWADTNRIIVLFPQTQTTPLNPQGCWDWWGYTGSGYLTRRAPQIIAVFRMIEALGQRPRV